MRVRQWDENGDEIWVEEDDGGEDSKRPAPDDNSDTGNQDQNPQDQSGGASADDYRSSPDDSPSPKQESHPGYNPITSGTPTGDSADSIIKQWEGEDFFKAAPWGGAIDRNWSVGSDKPDPDPGGSPWGAFVDLLIGPRDVRERGVTPGMLPETMPFPMPAPPPPGHQPDNEDPLYGPPPPSPGELLPWGTDPSDGLNQGGSLFDAVLAQALGPRSAITPTGMGAQAPTLPASPPASPAPVDAPPAPEPAPLDTNMGLFTPDQQQLLARISDPATDDPWPLLDQLLMKAPPVIIPDVGAQAQSPKAPPDNNGMPLYGWAQQFAAAQNGGQPQQIDSGFQQTLARAILAGESWAQPVLDFVARQAWSLENGRNTPSLRSREMPDSYAQDWRGMFGASQEAPGEGQFRRELDLAARGNPPAPAAIEPRTPANQTVPPVVAQHAAQMTQMSNTETSGSRLDPEGLIRAYQGVPYTFGGPGGRSTMALGTPTDCSGFVSAAVRNRYGVALPAHTDSALTFLRQNGGREVSAQEGQMGDIVFYMGAGTGGAISNHMGLYLGAGKVIDMSGGRGVGIRNLNSIPGALIMRDPRINGR
jgi:cell wall-associated NlpC family hydrolase